MAGDPPEAAGAQLRQVAAAGRQLVQSYRSGGFVISGRRYEGAILATPDRVVALAAQRLESLSMPALIEALRALDATPDILLLGTGSPAIVPDAWRVAARSAGFSLDAMPTPSACRTFNLLVAEDRRVAAALLPIA